MKISPLLRLALVSFVFFGLEVASASDLNLVLRRPRYLDTDEVKDFDAGKVTGFKIVTGKAFDTQLEPKIGSFTLEQLHSLELVVPYLSEGEIFLELNAERGSCYLSSFEEGRLSVNQQLVMDLVLSSKSAKIVCLTTNDIRFNEQKGPIFDRHEGTGLVIEGRP